MNIIDLSALLWSERKLLESYVSALQEKRRLLAAGEIDSVQIYEAEMAAKRLGEIRLLRDMEIAVVAKDLGMNGQVSLQELAAYAHPHPWGQILLMHDQALQELNEDGAALKASITRLPDLSRVLRPA